MKKKITIFLLVFVMLFGTLSFVNAAEINTKLTIVKEASETKELENDQGYISKTIVDSDLDKGEVTIELKLSNTKKNKSQEERFENTEVYIIIHEDLVLEDNEYNRAYINNLETLTSNILQNNSKTKVGIVGIKGPIYNQTKVGDKITFGSDDERNVNGRENDAEIVVNATNDFNTIKTGIQNMNSEKKEHRDNLQAAIRVAKNAFSSNVNKICILAYDQAPDTAIGVKSQISYGGLLSLYSTGPEAAADKYNKIASKTKSEILTLKNADISFILLRPEDTSYDMKFYNIDTGEFSFDFDGSPYVKTLYGTVENPTYGKMYTFNNDNIGTIISENIFKDVQSLIQADMNNVKIVDYFPDDIMENFDFSYVGDLSNGTVSDEIDEETKTITWNIGDLEGQEVATLKYKLKIKDMKNEELLGKEIATNEKVVLTYKDVKDKDYEVTLSSSPKIKLEAVEEKEELTATVTYDPTEETTGKVTATIKTNKKVNEVEGWTLSEDGKTLTKEYSENTTETVHLVDIDEMTKDVEIKITNIVVKKTEDDTTAKVVIPQAGDKVTFGITFGIALITVVVIFAKVKKYKDVK